jgi:lipopolysaccharide transport system ATP-binding protein
MKEPAIRFVHVGKTYPVYFHVTGGIKHFLFNLPSALRSIRSNRYRVLKDISFTVEKGEALGIIGRNGAGKSTLLGMIAGVLKPTEGTVEVKDRVSPLLELGAGFHPELTGRENVELNGVLLGLSRREVLNRLDRIVEFSELGHHIDQPLRTYSSGMTARLGFSVVAHLDPRILLIDEILTVGDIAFRQKCSDKMLEFRESGATMILVSHSSEEISRICDRVMWIEQHSVKLVGTPDEALAAYSRAMKVSMTDS